ncbi:MAG: preprotein translocase subunit SecA [Solobacterium sp.]|nr:preprotein translocase subunit SecA [Solobacterium sp.]
MGFLDNIFSSERRHYYKAEKEVQKVLEKESLYASMSDASLQAMTGLFLQDLERGKTLNDILPDAFAVAREAAKRVLGEFPFPVQILGGVLLHDGDIAEMKTGEGKTLTAVMPVYLNALSKKGVHVVTVNEYLAERDASWMGDIYRFLGLTVGCNPHALTQAQKREQFACDITYTTNSELGFDYLRDNMVLDKRDRVLRGLHYAILDEVDSILIDEARTPLIISGQGPSLDQQYLHADRFAKQCLPGTDVIISREDNSVSLSETGIAKAERLFHIPNIYQPSYAGLIHDIQNALRANFLMHRDVEYIVTDDEVILVDQFTGRKMAGREFSDGLHQAIQAKENVGIKQETITLATITYQNFFRLYGKLSGMTGTAKTEEDEFLNTYNMRVFEIPTNKPIQRIDEKDAVFTTRKEKYEAIVKETKRLYAKGQPVLIGTLSIGINEQLSELLKKEKIPHQVLNARNDADEAKIISLAGKKYAVTVATNMAGRGTDIKLGEGVTELGGLAVLGSERHESRRIDNQLRGRSGRQGDPGFSRFYCSMDDDLFEEYATEEAQVQIDRFERGKESEDKIRSMTDRIQKRAEGLHFDARKNTLEFDNVLMEQRHVIYSQRDEVLDMEDTSGLIRHLLEDDIAYHFRQYEESKDADSLKKYLMGLHVDPEKFASLSKREAGSRIADEVLKIYQERIQFLDPMYMQRMQKRVFLRTLDRAWRTHVDVMEHMKRSIHLRSYAGKKPIDAYKEEAFERFDNMLANIREQTIESLLAFVRRAEEEYNQVTE